MKRLFALLMIVVGTTAATANTSSRYRMDSCACPCPNDCRTQLAVCGDFCVDAELLIWRTIDCIDDYAMTPIATPTPPPPNNVTNLFSVTPEFDLGFRVNARYDRNCWFASGRYTWFQSSDINEVRRPGTDTNLYAQGFFSSQQFNLVSTRLRYAYEDANIRLGMTCIGNQCCQLYSWIEGRYAHIKSTRTIIGIQGGTFNADRDHSLFEGGGLGLGIGVQAQPLSCLQVSTEFTTVGLVGALSSSDLRTSDLVISPSEYPTKSTFVPGFNVRLEIAYLSCICGWDFSLFFAWEINEYLDAELLTDSLIALNDTVGPPPGATRIGQIVGHRQCENLGFGGPSIGFTVCY